MIAIILILFYKLKKRKKIEFIYIVVCYDFIAFYDMNTVNPFLLIGLISP